MSAPKVPLLLTRPRPAAKAFWNSLPLDDTNRMTPVYSPLLDIVPMPVEVSPIDYDGVILTSAQAVEHLPQAQAWRGKRAFAVGDATARAARQAGLDCESAHGDASDLLDLLHRTAQGLRLLHLRGTHSRGDIAEAASRLGVPTRDAVVYDQIAQPLGDAAMALLNGQHPVIVPLFSPRTAALYAAGRSGTADLYLVFMSDAVAAACATCPAAARYVAHRPTAVAMSEQIRQALSDIGPLEGAAQHV